MQKIIAGLVLAIVFVSAEASLCVPGVVPNITLYANYNLYWSEANNPSKCAIDYYVIDIFDSEDGSQYQLQTGKNNLIYNLGNMLDMCKAYSFEIHALTNESVLGPSIQYVATTSPLSNLNLSLHLVNATVQKDSIDFTWDLRDPDVYRCVSYYRVVYWDETNNPKDTYVTSNNFSLKTEVPCMNYTFQVNAFVASPDIEGPVTKIAETRYPEVPGVPTLISLVATNNSVTTVWKLEPYTQNHCKLSTINMHTLGVPTNITDIQVSLSDNVLRPNVVLSLTGLAANTVYVSNVKVRNVVGYSQNVTINYQTNATFVFDFLTDLSYN